MLLLVFKVLGWSVAHTPEFLLRFVPLVLGDVMFVGLRRRRRLMLSNLHHAFPDRAPAWHRRIGRESCRRLIETGLLSLASPYLSVERMRRILAPTPELLACMAEHHADPAPTLLCPPHFAYWELLTALSLIVPRDHFPEFGVIYRPLDNAAADAFVKRARERFGMRLLSRREGFADALKVLRRQGYVGLLFDQNAGMQGALTLLLDRVCSTTELAGLMTEKFDARLFTIFARRRAFWRVEISVARVTHEGTSTGATLGLNRWLEQLLRTDENMCASWLWVHARWRNQDVPERRLRLEAKRNFLPEDLASRGLASPPRRTRIWIRMPNWLGDVVMAVPLLRALRASRPDAEITLIARRPFLPLLEQWGVADRLQALPPRGAGYWRQFWRTRDEFIDVWLLFTNSVRGDLEAWMSGTRQRFGIVRPGKRRPLLSHAFRLPRDFDESRHHQLELWQAFLTHFGLNAPADAHPVGPSTATASTARSHIGLIPGSENNPEKRWPVGHWRSLIAALPDEHFVVFGTANDLPIATAVAAGFEARVENRAGRTDLVAYAAELSECRLLVTNDTGGMHLANALGVPLIGLFGPTNPVRTGPVFTARATVLQPPGCPPSGGAPLHDLAPERVVAEVRHALDRKATTTA